VQVGTPYEIYNRPRDVFVAGFVGSPAMNLVKAELRDGKVTALSGKLEVPVNGAGGGTSGPVTLGVRSEDVSVGADGQVEAKVHHIEDHGVEKIVTLRVDEHLLRATVPATLKVGIDATVRFGVNRQKVHCFAGDTGVNLAYP
jgi:multiple sugar transport system ATP-binding protein